MAADAALYATIKDWSSKYILLSSTIVVEIDYELRDKRTGMVLWQATEKVVKDSGGAEGGLISGAPSVWQYGSSSLSHAVTGN